MNQARLAGARLSDRLRNSGLDFSILAPLVALIVLLVISSLASEYFLDLRNLTNITRQVSYTGIIAIGVTFVIIAAGIDLSVGSMVALVGVVLIYTVNQFADPVQGVIIGLAMAVLAGALFGLLNGALVTWGKITPFIATLATMSIYRSLALYFSDAGEMVSTNSLFPEIGGGYALGLPIPVWTFLIIAVLAHILLAHTPFGRHLCAVGSNAQVARYSGIRVQRIILITFVIAGACVGISSIMLASRLNSISPSDAGVFYELDAIAAVVIGGTALSGGRGSIWGTVMGALILGVINNMLNMLGISPYLQGLVKGGVILVAVLMQYKQNH
ncbi:ribose ABC transporter permease RbsC [Marinobacter nanhaiticus D15-8W]|uniref:ABC transporter permease n=1 Tax=Marinobacter nanhaiticus D15-8W TaxID=626887 RepID=N6WWA5_9GAMM|nr:ABC transporter permease [Marinobacter nanhaiticus]ENO15871.1 ABC transporter permease [Marinobacter nanhaiticus D15-8W]BES73271.1 ribose ABC transporter permease RbsC [Marinobacter nanhaiticus D15-8W]